MLYARGRCTGEWEALIGCLDIDSSDTFECDGDNDLEPKPMLCVPQKTAFDTCIQG